MINPFSVILMLIIIGVFCGKGKNVLVNLFILTCVIEIMFPKGYFIALHNETHYEVVAERVFLCYALYYWWKAKSQIHIRENIKYALGIFMIVMLVGQILAMIMPYENLIYSDWDTYVLNGTSDEHIFDVEEYLLNLPGMLFRLFVVLVSLLYLKCIFSANDIIKIVEKINKITLFYVIYLAFECIVKNLLNIDPFSEITNQIFGVGMSTYVKPNMRGDYWELLGFSREPSNVSLALFIIGILTFLEYYLKKTVMPVHKKMYIVGLIVLMIFSRSFTSVQWIAILLLIYVGLHDLRHNNHRWMLYTLTGIGLIFPTVFAWLFLESDSEFALKMQMTLDVLDMIMDGQSNLLALSSSAARMYSIYYVFTEVIPACPFFGMGLGVQDSHGGLATFLADFGILGSICWLLLIKSGFKYSNTLLFLFIVLPNIFASIGQRFYYIVYVYLIIECFNIVRFKYDKGD